MAAVGWFVKAIKDDQREQAKALADFRVAVAEKYVTHDRLEGIMSDIRASLGRIENRLDSKADK